MDPINIIVALNLFVTMSANYSGAKKGFKTSVTKTVDRPSSFLQKWPPNISALLLIMFIAGLFGFGTVQFSEGAAYQNFRIGGLLLFIAFSWLQIYSYKSLGKDYAQDVVILKGQELHTGGIYRYMRHPQYLSQILSDLGAAAALSSAMAIPAILIEIPLFIMRARLEDKMLAKHFGNEYEAYRSRSGFMIPFVG